MRFLEIPALLTEDIETPDIVDITEPITASISGTTLTIDGGNKVSGEATITLAGDVTVNTVSKSNLRQPSIHKITVKTNGKGNFTYTPNTGVTASSVSSTIKTGSDFEILLITTKNNDTYLDLDLADYTSPAVNFSNALTGFDITDLTSTYGATAKLYKPDGTLLTTVSSAGTGSAVGFGAGAETTAQEVNYKLEVTDDVGRKSTYDLPRKWISYAMETSSTPGFQKFKMGSNEYTSTTVVPNLSSTTKARVYKTSDHGYLGINFKIQGRNSTSDAWTDIDSTGENVESDESAEFLAFGNTPYLYHRVWVKPTAKASTTVTSDGAVTLTLSNVTEDVTKTISGKDPYSIDETSNVYVFDETAKFGSVPLTITLGSETYSNATTATVNQTGTIPNTDFSTSKAIWSYGSSGDNYLAAVSGSDDAKYIGVVNPSDNEEMIVYKGDPSTGSYALYGGTGGDGVYKHVDHASTGTYLVGEDISWDGKYMLLKKGHDGDITVFKNNETDSTFEQLIANLTVTPTTTWGVIQFIPKSYDFVMTRHAYADYGFRIVYFENSGDTWTEKWTWENLNTGGLTHSDSDTKWGCFGFQISRDKKYAAVTSYGNPTSVAVLKVDLENTTTQNKFVKVWEETISGGNACGISPDGKYIIAGNQKIFKNNDAGDWTTKTEVQSDFTGASNLINKCKFVGEKYVVGGNSSDKHLFEFYPNKEITLTYNSKDRLTLARKGGLTTTSVKLYKDGTLYHTFGDETVVFIDETGVYQAVADDTYYSNEVTVTTVTETEARLYLNKHACFLLKKDGKVWYWGESTYGTNAMGNNTEVALPTLNTNLNALPSGIKQIGLCGTEAQAACAITNDGKLYTWGYNGHGQLGRGNETDYTDQGPWLVDTQSSNTFTSCHSAWLTNFALQNNGYLWACGHGGHNIIGNGSSNNQNRFVRIDLANVIDYHANNHHALALTNDGKVYIWGLTNGESMAGVGSTTTPTHLTALDGKNIVKVRTGGSSAHAISSDGKLYSWGNGSNYGLPSGSNSDITAPTEMTWFSRKNIKVVDVQVPSEGSAACLALDDQGNMYVWGEDDNGAIGVGPGDSSPGWPFLLKENIASITAGCYSCGCIDKFGQVYTWGDGGAGQQNWIHGATSDTDINLPTSNNLSVGSSVLYDGSDRYVFGKDSTTTSNVTYGSNTLALDTKSEVFVTDPHTYKFKIMDTDSVTYTSNVVSTVSRPTGRVYPPRSGTHKNLTVTATANAIDTWTIDGALYGNGAYKASMDKARNGTTQFAWNVFNGIIHFDYLRTDTGITSAAIQLHMPQKIKLTKYALYSRYFTGNYTNAPKDWKVYGSNDETNWTELDSQTNQTVTAWGSETDHRDTKREYTVTGNTKYFSSYKLDVTATGGGQVDLNQIEYYGDEEGFLSDDGYGKLTLDVKGDTNATSNVVFHSNTYAMGATRDLYIKDTGEYSVDIYGSNKHFLGSKTHTVSAKTTELVWKSNEDQILYGSDPGADDNFGHAIGVDGNYAVVGSRYNDTGGTDRGAAFIFHKSGGTWTEQAMVQASDASDNDWFGRGAAISGDYVIVNAYAKTTNNTGQGAAYIYKRSLQENPDFTSNTNTHTNYSSTYGWDTNSGWEVAASSEFNSSFAPWMAFNKKHTTDDAWTSGSAPSTSSPQWLRIKYPSAQVIKSYEIRSRTNTSSPPTIRYPTAWKLQGSVSDGTTWVDIGSEQTESTWSSNTVKSYDVSSNTTAYQYYRLRITDSNRSDSDSANTYVGIGDWKLFTGTSQTYWTEQAKLTASDAADGDAYSYSVDIDGDYAICSALNEDPGGTSNAGSAYIYKRTGSNWEQQAKIQASDKAADDKFGRGVTISGDYAAVGADQEDTTASNAGSVYIFKRETGDFTTSSQPNTGSISGAGGGNHTQFNGDTFYLIPSKSTTSKLHYEPWGTSGNQPTHAFTITKSGSNYVINVNDTGATGNPANVSAPGGSAASTATVSAGDTVTIYDSDGKTGTFTMPTLNGPGWAQQQKIQASDAGQDDTFGGGAGQGVSLSGDYLAVGARQEDTGDSQAGSVYIFKKDDGAETWTQQAKLQASDVSANSEFGASVSLSGTTLAVGANAEDTAAGDAGAAYIFERSGTTWTEVKRITASDAAASDYFGGAISTDGTTTFVGAWGEDTKGSGAGAAYVFEKGPAVVPTLNFDGYNKLSIDNVSMPIDPNFPVDFYHSTGYWAGTSPVHYHKLDTTQSNETSKLYELWQSSAMGGQYGIGFYNIGNTTVLKVNEGDNTNKPTYFKINGSGSHESHVIEVGDVIELWGDTHHEGGFTVTSSILFPDNSTPTITIKKDDAAFATTTSNTVYIREAGTYTAEVKTYKEYVTELSKVLTGSIDTSVLNEVSNISGSSSFASGINTTGFSFSSDGNRVVIGEPESHKIHIYNYINNTWTLDKTVTKDNNFGSSVVISKNGNKIIACKKQVAYLFINGVETASIQPANCTTTFGQSGLSISNDGNYVVVGDYSHGSDTGKVYVYDISNNSFSVSTSMNGTSVGDSAGKTTLLNKDGTRLFYTDGSVIKIYQRTNSTWQSTTSISVSGSISIDEDGDRIAVGESDPQSGTIYLRQKYQNSWSGVINYKSGIGLSQWVQTVNTEWTQTNGSAAWGWPISNNSSSNNYLPWNGRWYKFTSPTELYEFTGDGTVNNTQVPDENTTGTAKTTTDTVDGITYYRIHQANDSYWGEHLFVARFVQDGSGIDDKVKIYVRNSSNGTFSLEQTITGVSGDAYGSSVSLNGGGDKLFIGSKNNGSGKGLIEYWTKDSSNTWNKKRDDIVGETTTDKIGDYIATNLLGSVLGTHSSNDKLFIYNSDIPSITYDGKNKLTISGTNYADTSKVTKRGGTTYDIGTAKTMYIKETGDYDLEVSGSDTFAVATVNVGSVDLAGATTKPIDFDGYNKLTFVNAGANAVSNVSLDGGTKQELGSATTYYIKNAGTYTLEMSGSNVFALSSNVVDAVSEIDATSNIFGFPLTSSIPSASDYSDVSTIVQGAHCEINSGSLKATNSSASADDRTLYFHTAADYEEFTVTFDFNLSETGSDTGVFFSAEDTASNMRVELQKNAANTIRAEIQSSLQPDFTQTSGFSGWAKLSLECFNKTSSRSGRVKIYIDDVLKLDQEATTWTTSDLKFKYFTLVGGRPDGRWAVPDGRMKNFKFYNHTSLYNKTNPSLTFDGNNKLTVTNFTSTEKEWPPSDGTRSSVTRTNSNKTTTWTISGASYGNGEYTADTDETVWASGSHLGYPDVAFNKSTTLPTDESGFITSNTPMPVELRITLPNAIVLGSYKLQGRDRNDTQETPGTWTMEGSNDGTTWTVIDTQTAANPALDNSKTATYTVSGNSTAYNRYKLNITATNATGGGATILGELYLYEQNTRVGTLTDPSGRVHTLGETQDTFYISETGDYTLDVKNNDQKAIVTKNVGALSFGSITPTYGGTQELVSPNSGGVSETVVTTNLTTAYTPSPPTDSVVQTRLSDTNNNTSGFTHGVAWWDADNTDDTKIFYTFPYWTKIDKWQTRDMRRDWTFTEYSVWFGSSTSDLTKYATYSFSPTNQWSSGTGNTDTQTLSSGSEQACKVMAFSFDIASSSLQANGGLIAGPGVAEIKVWGYQSTTVGSLTVPTFLKFDGYNKLTLTDTDSDATSNIDFFSNTYEMGSRKELIISDYGTYYANTHSSNTLALSKKIMIPESDSKKVVFHHGDFSSSDYSSAYSTVSAAATAGHVYANTSAGTYSWGTLGEPDTNTSGQTGYTWTPASTGFENANVLMVAGGGGGGGNMGGGGGAGGLVYNSGVSLSGAKTIVVGNGSSGGVQTGSISNGNDTSFTGLTTAIGGGSGGGGQYSGAGSSIGYAGGNGGSGGGGTSGSSPKPGGTGTSGQGNDGGGGDGGGRGGGGGGAGSAGETGNTNGNDGGAGLDYSSVFGTMYGDSGWFASGGGGGGNADGDASIGGGGDGHGGTAGSGSNAIKHTGGGGGGGGKDNNSGNIGGDGGSGVVIVKTNTVSITHPNSYTNTKGIHVGSQVNTAYYAKTSSTFSNDILIGDKNYSVSYWINITSSALSQSESAHIWWGNNSADDVMRVGFNTKSGKKTLSLQNNSCQGNIEITPDVWHHIVLARQSSPASWISYVDGVKDDMGNGSQGDVSTNREMYIGYTTVDGGVGKIHEAYMDDISIWNKTLTQSDVDSIYVTGPSNLNSHASATNLMAWWKFEDNGDDSATGSSNNLTINNTGWYSSSAVAKKPVPSLTFDGYNKLTLPVLEPTFTETRLSDWDNNNQGKSTVTGGGDWPDATMTHHQVLHNGDKSYQYTCSHTNRDAARLFTTTISGDWAYASYSEGAHSPMSWGYKFSAGKKMIGKMILTQPPGDNRTAGNVTIKYWDGSAMVAVKNQSPTGMSSQSYDSSTTFTFHSVSSQYWQIDCYRGSINTSTASDGRTALHGWQLYSGIDPVSTVITKGSDSYDIGTASSLYIDAAGTYDAQAKNSNTFVIKTSNTVSGSGIPVRKQQFKSTVQKLYPSDGGTVSDNDKYGYVGLSGNGLVMVVCSYTDDDTTSDAGGFMVYEKVDGVWTFTQQITNVGSGSNNLGNSDEGKAVQLDYTGTRVFMGSHGDDHGDTNTGSVYIYRRVAKGNWTLEQRIDGAGSGYKLGYNDVNNDGDKLIIGSYGYSSNTGRAWYYTRSGTTWSLQNQLAAPSSSTYGVSVSINSAGTRAIVGGKDHSSGTGRMDIWNLGPPEFLPPVDSVGTGSNYRRFSSLDTSTHYVYRLWHTLPSIDSSLPWGSQGQEFRHRSSTSTHEIYEQWDTGSNDWNAAEGLNSIQVNRATNTWSDHGSNDPLSARDNGDGTITLVGGYGGVSDIYKFTKPSTFVPATGTIKVSKTDLSDWSDNDSSSNPTSVDTTTYSGKVSLLEGSTEVYRFSVPTNSWSIGDGFTGEGTYDYYGWNVDMSNDGNTVVVGAPYYSGTGGEGRAYIYTTSDGTNWSLSKTLLNQTADELFGWSVQISGDGNTIVIGAYANDDDASDAGRSYVYEISGGSWPSTPTYTIKGTSTNSQNGWTLGISDTADVIISGAPLDDDSGTNRGAVYILEKEYSGPTITYDNTNKLSIEGVTNPSTTLTDPNGSSFDIGAASNVYIRDAGTYSFHTNDGNQAMIMSNTVSSTPSGTTYEIITNIGLNKEIDSVSGYLGQYTHGASTDSEVTNDLNFTKTILTNGYPTDFSVLGTNVVRGSQTLETGQWHSNNTTSPWFRINLEKDHYVDNCVLHRTSTSSTRYSNVRFQLLDSSETQIKEVDVGGFGTADTFVTADCKVSGVRYVKVVTTSTSYTHYDEIRINGYDPTLGGSGTTPSHMYHSTSNTFTVSNIPSTQTSITGKIYKGATAYTIHATQPNSNVVIKNTGTYVSVFTTASTAYISNAWTVDAITDVGTNTIEDGGFVPGTEFSGTVAFHHGTFADSGDPHSDGSVTAAATAGHVYSDTATGTYTWGTLSSVTLTASPGDLEPTSGTGTPPDAGKTEYKWTPPIAITNGRTLVVAGGGGGGTDMGGGGGAGGLLASTTTNIAKEEQTITVGGGGTRGLNAGGSNQYVGGSGGNSSISGPSITAIGGGGGGTANEYAGIADGISGGSGGGGSGYGQGGSGIAGGAGTSGQGYAGAGRQSDHYPGGGGGAGAAGEHVPAHGGDGVENDILGTSYWWAGGGGGAGHSGTAGNGGKGGGGAGTGYTPNGINPGTNDTNGITTGTAPTSTSSYSNDTGGSAGKHTGGGGGGGEHNSTSDTSIMRGGRGGSGIVAIKFTAITPPVIPWSTAIADPEPVADAPSVTLDATTEVATPTMDLNFTTALTSFPKTVGRYNISTHDTLGVVFDRTATRKKRVTKTINTDKFSMALTANNAASGTIGDLVTFGNFTLAANTITSGEHSIATNFDGTTSNVYVDGVLVTQTTPSITSGAKLLTLGQNYAGRIKDFKFWNKPISYLGITVAFHYFPFASGGDPYSDGSVTAAATAGHVYSDTPAGTYTWGTLGSASQASQQATYTWTPISGSFGAKILMVAGGGGGAMADNGNGGGGGGGAGGLVYNASVFLSGQKTIKVGGPGSTITSNGADTEFTGLTTAIGGGKGSGGGGGGASGGSGGGGFRDGSGYAGTAGQGYAGGDGNSSGGTNQGGSGGGGAGGAGAGANGANGANGGVGLDYSSVFGTTYGDSGWFASGGGGGFHSGSPGTASNGGGGAGGSSGGSAGGQGQKHTGGGGGGGSIAASDNNGSYGASGIVLIKY